MHFDETIKNLPALLGVLFIAILFLQSALDKVFDWNGNLEWLTGHFAKTFMAKFVPAMLIQITVLEMATGLAAVFGLFAFFVSGTLLGLFYASALGAISITALFFGQRVAKDYAGAAVLVPYFILMLILLYLTNPYLRA